MKVPELEGTFDIGVEDVVSNPTPRLRRIGSIFRDSHNIALLTVGPASAISSVELTQ